MKAKTTARDRAVMISEIASGLGLSPKRIPSKYFYDETGSELFEEITRLPEYYLTRTERALLERWGATWVRETDARSLVELGAGAAEKTRWLLEPMLEMYPGATFVPLDVSEDFLAASADRLRREHPGLEVVPVVADFTRELDLPEIPGPVLFTLLGSTIGNFDPEGATRLLRHVRDVMRPDDEFMLGADLRPGRVKTVELLEAAYDDSLGVTARFNLNVLEVLNRELGTDFDVGAFRHRSFYDPDEGRIEMHLVATGPQRVALPGHDAVEIAEGESIRTEISCKYDRPTLDALFGASGLELDAWVEDERGFFALVRGRVARG